ncbi:hypothetical protein [Bifidobacterium moukalabense]|uniref:Anaerobic C4-dicarboxylate transport protein n=1 Tax=Bifidobacterium moukalabense DSM 27321 TaxID=1435051 RepID=W4N959_9BIFI|nr:hypothetical protein [Bifidobacterium moukalabense]ETY71559.1 anaerobic C4-dicarboxylate transport protein [Bifidobacterium moukalabense DSM 27321]
MLDILPALLWIIAAVIAVNICSICSIRGGLFSHKDRPVYPVRWSIIGLHFTSLVIGALPYPLYSLFRENMAMRFQRFYEHLGWPSAAVMIALIAAELAFMYLQARKGMKSEMERRLNQTGKPADESE